MQVLSINDSPSRLDGLDAAAINKLLLRNDWRELTRDERIARYRTLCDHLSLDWRDTPIDLIQDREGRLRPYVTARATQQLEVRHCISTTIVDRRIEDGYVVRAVRAWLPNGREKVREGAVAIGGKQGQERADAAMWAETKASRRASLALLGIGLPDESEALDYIGGRPATFDPQTGEVTGDQVLEGIEAGRTDDSITIKQWRWYKDRRDAMGWSAEEEHALLAMFGAERIEDVERGDTFTAVIRLVQDPEALRLIRSEIERPEERP